VAEEREEHARRLREWDEIRAIENRQDRLAAQIDTIFEILSAQLVGKLDRMEGLIAAGAVDKTEIISAVNTLAGRVDGMGTKLELLGAHITRLDKTDAALGDNIRTTEAKIAERMSTLETKVADIEDKLRPKIKRRKKTTLSHGPLKRKRA